MNIKCFIRCKICWSNKSHITVIRLLDLVYFIMLFQNLTYVFKIFTIKFSAFKFIYIYFKCGNGKQFFYEVSPQVSVLYQGKFQQLQQSNMMKDKFGFCTTFNAYVCTKVVKVKSTIFKIRKLMITGPSQNQR